MLKRLRGAPIIRHDDDWQMAYNPHPPYELLQNRLIDFPMMQKLRRFARYWDLVGNSGNFVETAPLIWGNAGQASRLSWDHLGGASQGKRLLQSESGEGSRAGGTPALLSPFAAFMCWSEWLHERVGRTDSIALVRLMGLLFQFLTTERRLDPKQIAAVVWRDYQRGGRHDKPAFLKDLLPADTPPTSPRQIRPGVPKRQARHLV
jgi:hypothetical protein